MIGGSHVTPANFSPIEINYFFIVYLKCSFFNYTYVSNLVHTFAYPGKYVLRPKGKKIIHESLIHNLLIEMNQSIHQPTRYD